MLLRLGGIVLVLGLALWLWALFEALTVPAERIRLLPKLAWVVAILLLTVVGAAGWFVLGRPREVARTGARRHTVGPDDDPDFLRRLAEDMRRRRDEPS